MQLSQACGSVPRPGARCESDAGEHIPSGCAIAGIFRKDGRRVAGDTILRAMEPMHDRSNGLGGGFAGYGIYPDYADCYAFHLFYEDEESRGACETYLHRYFDVACQGPLPVRKTAGVADAPLIWRYFVRPKPWRMEEEALDERAYTARRVMAVNSGIPGAYIFSSGKNMGVFKGVGFPEDIGRYFRLDEYEASCWTAHGRYPTNTPGWWGGAHPFALLDLTVVHNGEISSYDANRRCMEMYGYDCSLLTDTEVITYMLDYLTRRQRLSWQEAAQVIAAPFWSVIDRLPENERKTLTLLRRRFSSLLITGPFSILVGFEGGMMALNDRLKLRSMVVGEDDAAAYVASEECAIRRLAPDIADIRMPRGGEPVIFTREGGKA
jgi:glutamate synthase domain-containing protein 1